MVEFKKIDAESFKSYLAYFFKDYSRDLIKAFSLKIEDAENVARTEIENCFPDKKPAKHQKVFNIFDTEIDQRVGVIWYEIRKTPLLKEAYLSDMIIFKPFRKKGYATDTLRIFELHCKKDNIKNIQFRVFRHNKIALKLITNLGYKQNYFNLMKSL